jgi:hypothetical protein
LRKEPWAQHPIDGPTTFVGDDELLDDMKNLPDFFGTTNASGGFPHFLSKPVIGHTTVEEL